MITSLTIDTFILGPIQNNTYLISNTQTNQAIIIDPAAGIEEVIKAIKQKQLQLNAIWVTHAHFDHIAGVYPLLQAYGSNLPIYLHANDLPLWEAGGGAPDFGYDFNPHTKPNEFFYDKQILPFTTTNFIVYHTPGHTPGHVIFYCKDLQTAFCGDLIFFHGVGRTDLPYGNEEALRQSLKNAILTLPDNTLLLCGHGRSTTVEEERKNNPFLND